tara:strand:+ start:59 stop:292 length:234 start_codon:yes stop_codon:yes gene_type:complete
MPKSIEEFVDERKKASPHQPFFDRYPEWNKYLDEAVKAVNEKDIPILAVAEWLNKEVGVPLSVSALKKYVTEKVKNT